MTHTSQPIFIQDCAFHSAMGMHNEQIHSCLSGQQASNMVQDNHILNSQSATIIGRVKQSLPSLPERLMAFNSRNNRLALSAMLQIQDSVNAAIAQFGSDRIAVIIGTSTSGIADGELAYKSKLDSGDFFDDFHYQKQELGNTSDFIAAYFGISGPCYSISTACSSSGRVFISAQRLLHSKMVDAVIVGGVDSVCQLTLNGFNSLEALSATLCQPFSASRNGINIGESAALMLLSYQRSEIALLGAGDSSDAYHISAPQPEGLGAEQAMQKALHDAGLAASDIGYVNAHGTATPLNDSMESKAIYRLFGSVPVSSTKPLTGHTLGAASATEAAIAWHILKYNLELPQQHCNDKADDIEVSLVEAPIKLQGKAILSNSFAFGGNNISLIFGYVNE
ncbi:beta-ketoacyl-[acyl-carrier-protein] synthase II [Vibrio sp. UCD-FRSSP16_10]|uniref:beta-ketoacyl-[acyl-carrier-protein] synthase family protein n=1 Tax=unclassified Vibrio TaxID=2614977 RepID=UPI0007FC6B35|nr:MULTISPECIES: beta-ketoacyl-[acyl-carrier-protein] synthase family protein [unclassified Vibrio]OBT14770.1 beta-ketoacyl-[acyl-carrier-protein] synthase II [Vibrio sp. UCD-FRSSP16_30]OBT20059.1 beta-ketoacyl-[acyl-carrier-protein] synthase II [Vibrio sp. UCD-FRSSP16_10]